MDFGEEEEEAPTVVVTNSSHLGDDDVEVKHTIVVSTKLKNNNRRGITNNKGKPHLNDFFEDIYFNTIFVNFLMEQCYENTMDQLFF